MGSIIQDVMIKFQGDATGLANATASAKKVMSDFYKSTADLSPENKSTLFAKTGEYYSQTVQKQREKVVKLINDTNASLVAGGKVTTATVNKIRREYAILQDIPNRFKAALPKEAFTPTGRLKVNTKALMESMIGGNLSGLKEEIAAVERKAYALALDEAQKYEQKKIDKLRSIRINSKKKELADSAAENQKLVATKNKLGEREDVENTRMILAEQKYKEQKKKQRADRKKERQKEAEEEEKETRKLGLTQIAAQKEFTNKQNKEAINRTKAAIKAELAERKLAVMQMAAYKEDTKRFPTMFGRIQEWFSKGAGKIATTIASFYSLYQVWRLCAQAAKFLFNESVQLQTAFARINAMALVSGKNYSGLRKSIFDLGTAHGFLATEVTSAIQPLVQMGLTTEEIAVITNRAMQVSNITGTALGESINTVISAMAAYNLTAQESADLLVYWGSLASTHAVSIHSIAKGFEQAGETFHEFGFNVKEVSSIMAVLMEQERGSLAGITRFLRLVLENLGKTKEAADIYKYMGVTVLDPTGGLRKDSFQVLKEMSVAWESMTGAQKNNLKQGMTNKSMMEGLYAVMAKFPEIEEAIAIGLEKGRKLLDAQSKIMEDTFVKKWESLKNAWIELLQAPFGNVINATTEWASGLTTVLQRLKDINIEYGKRENKPESRTSVESSFYGLVGGGVTIGGLAGAATTGPFAPLGAVGGAIAGGLIGAGSWLVKEAFDAISKTSQAIRDLETGANLALNSAKLGLISLSKNRIDNGELTGYGNKDSKDTTDAMLAQRNAAQDARDFANEGYAKWKKQQDTMQATRENNFKIATEQYKLEQGYQVGINKELQDELTTRRELADTLASTSNNLAKQLAKQKEITEKRNLLFSTQGTSDEVDKLNVALEEVKKNISASNLKLAETKTALELQETVVRKIGETYRNMILDTMVEIIEKTQNWLDLNYKLRDLLSNIGNDVLRKVLDRITGGFVDKLGSLGSLATNQKGSSTANIAGLGAVGVASAAGGYAYIKGKGWVPAKGVGAPSGLGFSDYAGAGMMGAAIGSNRGTKGMAGGAIGSMAGMALGNMLLPGIGGMLGATAGGWLGSLLGKPKKDETKAEETAKTWTSIPSKIDVTNSELQVVNRNLIALKEKFEPYPLPSSAYFSSRNNAALGIGAGNWGKVTININGSGDPQATANAVASIFSMNSLQGAQ